MNWFDIVKVQTANSMFAELSKPKQDVAQVEFEGDNCCETAREELKDLMLEGEGYLHTTDGRKLRGQDAANHIDGKDCAWIEMFLEATYQYRFEATERNRKEIERIYNDWEECKRA